MAHLVAAREALERFAAELPAAGSTSDRLRRVAASARSLAEQALADDAKPGPATAWLDHDLAVLVSEGLADESTEAASLALFRGIRRRLGAALEKDPDDLACALALALGAARVQGDERTAEDVRLVARGLARPHAGPRLVGAGVALCLSAAGAEEESVQAAAREAVGAVREALDRVLARAPSHPDAALDRARLELLGARDAEGEARQAGLDRVHALLSDHESRFGASTGARDLRAELLEVRARTGAPAADVRRDGVALVDARLADHTLDARAADRILRAMERAGALDAATAAALWERLDPLAHEDGEAWRRPLGRVLQKSGDEAAVLTHWEETLRADPKDAEAAKGLADRLLRNLRAGQKSPFASDVLEKILDAVPHPSLARWSADDVDAVLDLVASTFGVRRAADFCRQRLLENRELRKRDGLWRRGLALHRELGDADLLLEVAREGALRKGVAEARIALAEILLEKGERLEEADEALRPLYDAKGKLGAEAHALRQKLARHPGYRAARRTALLAFEERAGVGSGRPMRLRVIHTTPTYALVEESAHQAPDVYEHKHLRTVVRAQDLPGGVSPLHLRKGDTLQAPLRGEDADPRKDKEGLRIYWIADPAAIRLDLSPADVESRLDEEEKRFGIGQDRVLPLRVALDGRRKELVAQVLGGRGPEFYERAAVSREDLPEGVDPERLGKGRRLFGKVERDLGAETGDGRRAYRVAGRLETEGPESPPPAGDAAAEEEAETAPLAGEDDTGPIERGEERPAAEANVDVERGVEGPPREIAPEVQR